MRRPVLLAALALVSGICHAAGGGHGETDLPRSDPFVSMAAVDQAIALAKQYLVGACGPNGKFVYQVRIADGKTSPDYNVVRHAGAMYVLAMLDRSQPDRRVAGALERSAKFLCENYIRPGPLSEGEPTLAVWKSPPGEPGDFVATLGATGLGLVGLVGAEARQPASIPAADLKALGQFLLFLQKKDGSFNSKYLDRKGGKFTAWGSLYYPGEAALALVSLYESDGSEKWLAGAEAALGYLAKSRASATDVPADNWALIATAKLLSLPDPSRFADRHETLVRHAVQICEGILAAQIEDAAPDILNGGFHRDGRTTPTATRLEGLLAALEFLPPDRRELRARITTAVRRGILFLLKSQIPTGRYAGGIPETAPGVGDSSLSEVRIDYVQHFLAAMLGYRKLFDS